MATDVEKPLIQAAFGRTPKRTPIWFLRQAGRYLPEYREVRKDVSFVELCQTPKLAAEVTLQPLRRYDLDASIIFSDILIPPMVMGQNLSFDAGHGPRLDPVIRSQKDLKILKIPDAEKEMGYVGEAIGIVKENLSPEQTMIGFAGAPFTVASYMIEGQGSKTFTEVKRFLFKDPEGFGGLLDQLVEVTKGYLAMQVQAGADALMLFDTWAGQLTPLLYREFLAKRMQKLIKETKLLCPGVPILYFPGQGSELYPELKGMGMDVVAVDWRVSLAKAIKSLKMEGVDVSVQGNLDPQFLLAPGELLKKEVQRVIAEGALARGHIFNVGHGLLPHLDPESLNTAISAVRNYQVS